MHDYRSPSPGVITYLPISLFEHGRSDAVRPFGSACAIATNRLDAPYLSAFQDQLPSNWAGPRAIKAALEDYLRPVRGMGC
jgi:hypothetical protein